MSSNLSPKTMGVDDDVDEVLDPNYNPYLGDSDDDDFC